MSACGALANNDATLIDIEISYDIKNTQRD